MNILSSIEFHREKLWKIDNKVYERAYYSLDSQDSSFKKTGN